jgi:hypothetical protein
MTVTWGTVLDTLPPFALFGIRLPQVETEYLASDTGLGTANGKLAPAVFANAVRWDRVIARQQFSRR